MGKSKYGNKKCELNGHKFDSKKEMERYIELAKMQENGIIKDLEMQVAFEVIPKQPEYKLRATKYIADFVYTRVADNKKVVEDVKGFNAFKKGWSTETPEFKIKKKLFLLKFGKEYEFNIV